MLSGIGAADELRAHGIRVMQDLPEVGRNLQDHLLVAGVAYAARRAVPRSHYNHADALLYVPRDDPREGPDHLVMCLSLPFVLPEVGKLAAAGLCPDAVLDDAIEPRAGEPGLGRSARRRR